MNQYGERILVEITKKKEFEKIVNSNKKIINQLKNQAQMKNEEIIQLKKKCSDKEKECIQISDDMEKYKDELTHLNQIMNEQDELVVQQLKEKDTRLQKERKKYSILDNIFNEYKKESEKMRKDSKRKESEFNKLNKYIVELKDEQRKRDIIDKEKVAQTTQLKIDHSKKIEEQKVLINKQKKTIVQQKEKLLQFEQLKQQQEEESKERFTRQENTMKEQRRRK